MDYVDGGASSAFPAQAEKLVKAAVGAAPKKSDEDEARDLHLLINGPGVPFEPEPHPANAREVPAVGPSVTMSETAAAADPVRQTHTHTHTPTPAPTITPTNPDNRHSSAVQTLSASEPAAMSTCTLPGLQDGPVRPVRLCISSAVL